MSVVAGAGRWHEGEEEPPRPSWVDARRKRRLDPLTYRACQAVDRALGNRRLDVDAAVIFATGYGSVGSTLRFAASMIELGEDQASPSPFTTSVHNATAGSLAELLDLHGPSTTISQGNASSTSALLLARSWLREERASRVLVVAGDLHREWSARTAAILHPEVVHRSGVAAVLLEAGGPGPRLVPGVDASLPSLLHHGGGGDARRMERLGHRGTWTQTPLGGWWPTAGLAALVADGGPANLIEFDGGRSESCHLAEGESPLPRGCEG